MDNFITGDVRPKNRWFWPNIVFRKQVVLVAMKAQVSQNRFAAD